jgi:hypothetical protein
LTIAEPHDIDSWDDVIRTAPQHSYVTKHLVGTPTSVDTDKADPVCPYCAAPADSEIDETTYYCSERCPASCDAINFQPIIEITSAFQMDIESARKLLLASSQMIYIKSKTSLSPQKAIAQICPPELFNKPIDIRNQTA